MRILAAVLLWTVCGLVQAGTTGWEAPAPLEQIAIWPGPAPDEAGQLVEDWLKAIGML